MTAIRSLPVALLVLAGCAGTAEDDRPAPLPAGVTRSVRGHQEVVVAADGSLRPRWLGSGKTIGLCLDAPIELDTSRWHLELRFDGRPGAGFEPPVAQAGTTLCFGQPPPPDLASTPELTVCATLDDAFDGRRYRVPCFEAVYDADGAPFEAQRQSGFALFRSSAEWPRERRIEAIDRLAAETESKGYPLLATILRLVAVDELRRQGTDQALADLGRRLAALPAWLARPEATKQAATVTYERAMFEIARGRHRQAWEHLAAAEDLARRVAANTRVAIAMRQAEILNRMGAGRESIARLRTVLADCDRWPCDPRLEPAAHGLLAWFLLIDPDAGPEELETAAASLAAAATSEPRDPRQLANRRLNAALLDIRRGHDPAPALDQAREALARVEGDDRTRLYLAWADLFAGLAALEAGEPERALDRCRRPAGQGAPRVAAWAWSCLGQARRRLGDLAAAAEAFDQALVRHRLATPELGQDRPLAPGRRVDDTYRAARVAIERRDPRRAWGLLEALDHRWLDDFTACEEEGPAVRRRLEERRQELLADLAWTEPPLAPERRRQLAPVRRLLMQSLDELQRRLLADCRRPLAAAPESADFRAFALPDEVVLLARSARGEINLRRTEISRRELWRRIELLAAAQGSGGMDDAAWRQLAAPLAAALLPPYPGALGEVSRFALHGPLQRLPLAALPLPPDAGSVAEGGSPRRWLGDLTTVVLRPAFVEATSAPAPATEPVPLFVVDPRRDLASAAAARAVYRRRFPGARILDGPAATRAAVLAAVAAASFLHVDAHGRFDAAFPELSALVMADGLLSFADVPDLPRRLAFINLSGCHTGGGLQTGDSGRYGLAGALARRSGRWVVAAQSAIEDRLAADFNDVFYRRIARGDAVPAAFRAALAAVRRHHPAASWSNLILLGAGDKTPSEGLLVGERRG